MVILTNHLAVPPRVVVVMMMGDDDAAARPASRSSKSESGIFYTEGNRNAEKSLNAALG